MSSATGSKASFGGKGLTITEVLGFLRSVTPQAAVRKSVQFGTGANSGPSGNSNSRYSNLIGAAAVQAVVASTPLVNGHALGVAFLGEIN